MNSLFIHNLKAGWRNLLKYKTQNIISVLCLSVGVVCLSVCVYTIRMFKAANPEEFDERQAKLYVHLRDGHNAFSIKYSELQKELKEQVSGVEDIYYLYRRGEDKLDVKMLDGKELTINGLCSYLVSNNYLEHRNWTSAITGKPIKHIKQGGAIIESYTRDRYFGKGVNPIGCTISNGTVTARIEDVIDMERMPSLNQVYLADDNVEEISMQYHNMLILQCVIKDDVPHLKLQEEFDKKCPKYNIDIGFSDSNSMQYFAIGIILFLGSCVLIVGMSGYLKMQMQLFVLRSREIALRRCNGARPSQLFVLLCSEILIVFAISGVLAALLLKLVSDFVMMMFAKFTYEIICFNFGYLYLDCLTICVAAFLVAVIIAWGTVRKVLTTPLGKTVGKSASPRSLGRSVMLVIQTLVCSLFLFAVLFGYQLSKDSFGKLYGDMDVYKNVYVWRNDVRLSEQCVMKSIDKFVELNYYTFTSDINGEFGLDKVPYRGSCFSDTLAFYVGVVADVDLLDVLQYDIVPSISSAEDSVSYVPIYVTSETLPSFRKKYNLDEKHYPAVVHKLPNNKMYNRIGYAYRLDDTSYYGGLASFYILQEVGCYLNDYAPTYHIAILTPKDGDINKLNQEIDAIVHDSNPKIPMCDHYYLRTLADEWFAKRKMYDAFMYFCLILVAVSVICIVLSMYSTVSLDTRGRIKEVAIRKAHGAKARHIILLFGKYYVKILLVSFVFFLVISLFAAITFLEQTGAHPVTAKVLAIEPALCSMLVITVVTFGTIWYKIFNASRINAAEVMKSE